MVEMRLLPLRVLLHTRRIGDLKLAGQVVDDLGRHSFQLIRQEPADITNRGELDTETKPIVITAAGRGTPEPEQIISEPEPEPEPAEPAGDPTTYGMGYDQELHSHYMPATEILASIGDYLETLGMLNLDGLPGDVRQLLASRAAGLSDGLRSWSARVSRGRASGRRGG